MNLRLLVRNESTLKHLYRRDVLSRLAQHICMEEGAGPSVELSLLFCDNPFIQDLNRTYRGVDRPTDVLSFSQEYAKHHDVRVLGDIVISLETVAGRRAGDRRAMREEVRLLFCHGMLHLLDYDHATARDRELMAARQAALLGISMEEAWISSAGSPARFRGFVR